MEKIVEVVRLEQVIMKTDYNTVSIRSVEDAATLAMELIGREDREVFLVIGVNTKNDINIINRAHKGSVNASIVSMSEVFKPLILSNSMSFIVAHNHPSARNTLTPSTEDIKVTNQLIKCGELLGIRLIDHIIVTDGKYISLREKGYCSF